MSIVSQVILYFSLSLGIFIQFFYIIIGQNKNGDRHNDQKQYKSDQKAERKKSVTSVPAATKIKKPAREILPSQTSSQNGKPVSTEEKIEQPQMEASEEGDKEVLITEGQKKEAEEIYWAAYRRMQYKNKKSYQEALTMFEKVVKLVPDNSFEFTAKAKEKIEQIQQKLDNL